MTLKYTKIVIDRSRFAAGRYDINLANEAERELEAMQARIEKLEEYPERLQKAITELRALISPALSLSEQNRIAGKIDGVKIALSYFEKMTR